MSATASPRRDPSAGRELKTLGRHSLVYGLGVALSKLAGFIMLPIYTRFLTPSDYGVIELLSTTVDVIGTIAGMGLANSVLKFHAEYDDPEKKKEVLSTAAITVLTLAGLTACIGGVFSSQLSDLVLGRDGRPLYFQIFFLIYLLSTAEALPLLLLRILDRSGLFVALSVGKLVAMLSLNVYFVVNLRMGVIGVLYSNLIATAVSGALLSVFLFRHAGLRFSRQQLAIMAKFGYPMIFVFLGNFLLVFSDRYFLGHFAGNAEVGIYSLAYRFAFVLSALAFTPFDMVWGPQRFKIARQDNASEVFSRVFVYLNLALGGIAVAIALFVKDFLTIMADPAFLPAFQVVPLILLAQVMYHWTTYANIGFFLKNRTSQFALASNVGVVFVVGLNFLLIPLFGMWGAAWATLLAYGIRFLSVHTLSQRLYFVDYRWGAIARMYVFFGAAVAVRLSLPGSSLPVSIAASLIILAVAGIAVTFVVLSPYEREQIRAFVVKTLGLGRRTGSVGAS